MVRGQLELGVWGVLFALSLVGCGGKEAVTDGGSGGRSNDAASGTGGSEANGGTGQTGGSGTAGSFGGTRPVVETPATVAQLCERYPEAWAAFMARCHGGEPKAWALRLDDPCAQTTDSENAGRIRLDAANAQDCFVALSGDDCTALEKGACDDLAIGAVRKGEACANLGPRSECEPGTYCSFTGPSNCAGTCRPMGTAGEGCHGQFVDLICGPGLECDGPANQCRARAAEGEACSGQQGLCKAGLFCDAEANTEGVCRPTKTAGPCRTGSACATGFKCITDDSGVATCRPEKRAGESCTPGRRECAVYCSHAGLCKVAAEEGEACGTLPGSTFAESEAVTCGAGLYCHQEVDGTTEGACRKQAAVGEPCPQVGLSGNRCQGGDRIGYCNSDQCVTCGE
ncbi:MAG TPA: hypothetical protein VFK05_09580 [Polyangiaceae bacterium]|nr:hypothetical protein [Polyangiaceae bacterium]